MLKSRIVFILLTFALGLQAQEVNIPDHIYFGGIKLNLSKGLRKEIQTNINTIKKNKTYFDAKAKQADTFFPIIEQAFEEESIPVDFKYLVIQESGLNALAVSSSNAVGYWQFKKESAMEVGLIIDSEIDERKHILEASRGAARYIKKNYLVTQNWIYALIAYNTGLGGAKQYIDSKYVGAQEMDLDDDLHWYAIKFLAYKLAYEEVTGYNKPEISILQYPKTQNKSLSDIASETQINEAKIIEMNPWLLQKKVPERDKNFIVLLPVLYLERESVAQRLGIDLNAKPTVVTDPAQTTPKISAKSMEQNNKSTQDEVYLFTTNNGLNGVVARAKDNLARLAFAGRISIERFRQYNEMEKYEEVKAGQIYYFESKNSKALVLYHTVKAGESVWDVAQMYGMKTSQLLKKNRMDEKEALQEGRLLYLRFKRPEKEPIIIAEKPKQAPPIEQKIVEPKADKKDTIQKKPSPQIKKDSIAPVLKKDTLVKSEKLPAILEPVVQKPEIETKAPVSTPFEATATPKDTLQPKREVKLVVEIDSSLSYHSVNQGQTLYALARNYGTKVDSIKTWNGVGTEGIKTGQKLIISKSRNSLSNNFVWVEVAPNQNLDDVAEDYHVSLENLLNWNGKKENKTITGELIKIKK